MIRVNTVDKAFSSQMTGMFAQIKTQIENLALENSRFVFDPVLFLDISFHNLKLT